MIVSSDIFGSIPNIFMVASLYLEKRKEKTNENIAVFRLEANNEIDI